MNFADMIFGDGAYEKAESGPRAREINATPFVWIDPKTIPRRSWIYKPDYVRGFVSLTVAAGGIGKSSLVLVEALAMVTGKPLLGVKGPQLRVWYINLEDPPDELQRRIGAICKHYEITPVDIGLDDSWDNIGGGRLFVDSGRVQPLVIVTQHGQRVIENDGLVADVIANIKECQIDVLIIDPLVSSHLVNENDNMAMGLVASKWAHIAEKAHCSVMLVHHAKKTGGERATVHDGRGASALLAATRCARVLNTMESNEAENAKIEEHERRRYFRSDTGKANLTPPAERADWYRLESVDLENAEPFLVGDTDTSYGDLVGVVTPFAFPEMKKIKPTKRDICRALELIRAKESWWLSSQSQTDWIGEPIATALGVDPLIKENRTAITKIIKQWIVAGYLERSEAQDGNHEKRPSVRAGCDPGLDEVRDEKGPGDE